MSLESKVEIIDLRLSARDLPDVSMFSNTDAFAVVYEKEADSETIKRIGVTEIMKDTQEPDWVQAIEVPYRFECVQELVIRLYHYDGQNTTAELDKHEFIGEVTVLLSTIVKSPQGKVSLDIQKGKERGQVLVSGESRVNSRDMFGVTMSGKGLKNKDGFFGKSDPFFKISRLNESGDWTLVFSGKHVNNDLNPKWKPVMIPMATLCNGDVHRPLLVEIFDRDSSGDHEFMGSVRTSVHSMLNKGDDPYDIIEEKRKEKESGYKNSGQLFTKNAFIEPHATFSDYIAGGCEISLMVGIDFTASNGDPDDPTSLHYHGDTPNEYQQAIRNICKVLSPYDSNQQHPVYGFGAKLHDADGNKTPCQHCFPVYGESNEVHGVQGIMKAYKDCLKTVEFSGPTMFAPLINAAMDYANSNACSQEHQNYTILLILTDGEIMDMDDTVTALIHASYTPLSVIIIGVGEADFTAMHALDKDVGLLKNSSEMACRDIVQFISYREATATGLKSIATEVLCEIPNQFLQFMEKMNFTPNPRK